MAAYQVVVRPPNSVILVGDPDSEPPKSMSGNLVSATSSCVAVGTLSDSDGETTVRLIDAQDTADLPPILVFQGNVETPGNRLTVASVQADTYLERQVDAARVPLKIWANDAEEPYDICVVVE